MLSFSVSFSYFFFSSGGALLFVKFWKLYKELSLISTVCFFPLKTCSITNEKEGDKNDGSVNNSEHHLSQLAKKVM